MSKLREGAIRDILNALNRGIVSSHNFDTKFNQADGCIVSITFRDAPEFRFLVLEPGSALNKSTAWRTSETPGEYFESEEIFDWRSCPDALGRISAWVNRFFEDLTIRNTQKSGWANDFRANLETAADSLPNPEEPFTDDEISSWKAKFDDLISRLSKLEGDHELQRGEVDRLRQQLDKLTTEGTSIPKRTWLKAVGHKIIDVFEHGSKSGAKALAEGAVKILLEHLK